MRTLLSDARHLVAPKGVVSTGFPSVQATCRKIGVEFDPWQVDLNRLLLAKTADGLYAADTAVLSIPRQVGKTFDIGAVIFALCIKNPGTTVVWTAHRFKVARETFTALRKLARRPELAPHLDAESGIYSAAGNESITFLNGSRIVFAARERGAVRGFSDVDVIVLDEAQILTEAAMADFAPTMNQAVNPLMILMGTPPKPADPGEVFTQLRADALAGESEGLLFVEFSADPGADPDDREQWRKANPSYPKRTPARAIQRLRKLLSVADFLREALGIWDGEGSSVISAAKWAALADLDDEPAPHIGKVTLAVDTDPLRARTSIVAAGMRADGLPMVELIENLPGVDWAVERLLAIAARNSVGAVVVDKRSAAASLIQQLDASKLKLLATDSAKMTQACGQFYDAATETGRLRHLDQIELNDALKGAVTRPLGDAWAWDRKKSTDDITPLTAATLALWGLAESRPKNPGRGRVIALN